MESDLSEYLKYLCNENDDLSSLIIVNHEGFELASSINDRDHTLVSGMCTALNCISKELIQELTQKSLSRMLLDCSDGVILIKPLNQEAILVASCKDAGVLNKLDVSTIQSYFTDQQDHIIAL